MSLCHHYSFSMLSKVRLQSILYIKNKCICPANIVIVKAAPDMTEHCSDLSVVASGPISNNLLNASSPSSLYG